MSAAGKFREIITLYTPASNTSDGIGGSIATGAETVTQLYARVQQLPAKEDLINNTISYRQPYKFTIRYTPGINNAKRIEWNDLKIGIASAVIDERKTEITLIGYGNS